MLAICWGGYPAAYGGGTIDWASVKLRSVDGESLELPPARFYVVCFLGTECPLAKLYGPRLQTLADQFHDRDVVFLGVNSNPQDSPAEITAYAKLHSLQFQQLKDADQSIADTFAAKRTPEVFIVDARGLVLYNGRIDDQYTRDLLAPHRTQHDLRNALTAIVAGEPIPRAIAQCGLPDHPNHPTRLAARPC